MKKSILLFIVILLHTVSSFAQKYVYSCTSTNQSEYYIYTDITKANNPGEYQVVVKIIYLGSSKDETIKLLIDCKNDDTPDEKIQFLYYSESIYLIDIKRNRSKTLSSTYKTFTDEIIRSNTYDEQKTAWEYIYPRSVMNSVLQTAKKYIKPEPIKQHQPKSKKHKSRTHNKYKTNKKYN